MKRLIARALVLGAIVLAGQWLVFALRGADVHFAQNETLQQSLKDGVDVVFFGDSTLYFPAERDTDHRNTVTMVQDLAPSLSILQLYNGGYNPDVYASFSRSMARSGHPPKTAVFVINMRAFSPGWDMRPMYQFQREKTILAFTNTSYRFLLRPLMVFKAFDLNPVKQKDYLELPVMNGDQIVGKVKDFDNDSFNTFSEENLQKKMIFSYMYDLDPGHRKVVSIIECIEALDAAGTRMLFYITPVDWQTGVEGVGEGFTSQLQKNIRVIEQVIQTHGGEVLDLSRLLPSEDFNWRVDLYPNGHLAQEGREKLANRLAAWLVPNN